MSSLRFSLEKIRTYSSRFTVIATAQQIVIQRPIALDTAILCCMEKAVGDGLLRGVKWILNKFGPRVVGRSIILNWVLGLYVALLVNVWVGGEAKWWKLFIVLGQLRISNL